jgi:hypothetical protein
MSVPAPGVDSIVILDNHHCMQSSYCNLLHSHVLVKRPKKYWHGFELVLSFFKITDFLL